VIITVVMNSQVTRTTRQLEPTCWQVDSQTKQRTYWTPCRWSRQFVN